MIWAERGEVLCAIAESRSKRVHKGLKEAGKDFFHNIVPSRGRGPTVTRIRELLVLQIHGDGGRCFRTGATTVT